MKLLLILTSSILLLSSCTTYRYDVTYEKCNGQTGSISFSSHGYTYIKIQDGTDDMGHKLSVPRLVAGGRYIRNVCDFSYTRNPIE